MIVDWELQLTVLCPDCGGEGSMFDCRTCYGAGEIENPDRDPRLCPHCGGAGRNHGGCGDL